jgi:hypothetical protein
VRRDGRRRLLLPGRFPGRRVLGLDRDLP